MHSGAGCNRFQRSFERSTREMHRDKLVTSETFKAKRPVEITKALIRSSRHLRLISNSRGPLTELVCWQRSQTEKRSHGWAFEIVAPSIETDVNSILDADIELQKKR